MKNSLAPILIFLFALFGTSALSSQLSTDEPLYGNPKLGYYNQSVDHFGELPNQTFEQRYWIDSEFASSPSAPVLFHICGEGNAEYSYYLNDNVLYWAKALGAHIVWLEHRYYGESLPFDDLSNEHMKYLTLENTMEDLAHFQIWITQEKKFAGPWISIGGSYSGTLSALYRWKHPELVVGALASSAPMKSIRGQEDYKPSEKEQRAFESTDPEEGDGERPWAYQACREFGFWYTVLPYRGMPLYTPSLAFCQQLFGDGVPFFNSDTYNQEYYKPFLSNQEGAPSHILFTYGGSDVWTDIGIPTDKNKISNPEITVLEIKGSHHHEDLNAPSVNDTPAIEEARELFLSLAREWIKK